ncbi:hypothetical protein PR003_g5561 [Phytophthora rubi]|uniref:Secreted protein n=1 Tax=Phytophthora rubi TaxID=129364 RepID=A0A6A4G4A6_9STRA|nr:hypothetical protein PR002_g4537 [Phytophthora rubi]KAE9044590.1 hypothetical protein PR001_g5297 [Phytophthora rubi]KAE9350027.1 hypothetical protein PR003_g5561 [Phytophthora rubi]
MRNWRNLGETAAVAWFRALLRPLAEASVVGMVPTQSTLHVTGAISATGRGRREKRVSLHCWTLMRRPHGTKSVGGSIVGLNSHVMSCT